MKRFMQTPKRQRIHATYELPMYVNRLGPPPQQLPNDKEYLCIPTCYTKQLVEQGVKMNFCNNVDVLSDAPKLGYLNSDLCEDDFLMLVRLLTYEQVKGLILDPDMYPHMSHNIVKINLDGSVTPYFIPDLGDLALFPKGLKQVLKWCLEKSEGTYPHKLMKIWECMSPVLPTIYLNFVIDRPVTSWSCFSDNPKVQLFTIKKPHQMRVDLSVMSENVSPRSRKYNVRLVTSTPSDFEDMKIWKGKYYSRLTHDLIVLAWNCQGVGRPSFVGNLSKLLQTHAPDILVLLETRMSKSLLTFALKHHNVSHIETQVAHEYGGIAIVSVYNRAHFFAHTVEGQKLSGFMTGELVTGNQPKSLICADSKQPAEVELIIID